MSKLTKIVGIVCTVIVVALFGLTSIHTSITDRFNPFISPEISYAQVPKGIQQYRNIKAYNPRSKKVSSLRDVGGYDPSGKYILIQHKGQYVKSIKYITKKQFIEAKK